MEWTGWYNQNIEQRLIGHYRLFQLFKKDKYLEYRSNSAYQSYILNYRGTQGVKYAVSKATALLFTFFTRAPYAAVEIEGLNHILVNEGVMVLHQFLIDAEIDLEQALLKATKEIESPEFMCRKDMGSSNISNYNLQINNHYPAAGKGAQGKERGVFSKKQILILLDLLADGGAVERVDYRKPNKFDNIAMVLQAVTGKKASSFKEELQDYKGKGLYDWNAQGELEQLIRELRNLAELFREAGFHSIAERADKKIRELEQTKSNFRS